MLDRIKACFTESIQTQIAAAEALPDAISRAAMTLVQSLLNGNTGDLTATQDCVINRKLSWLKYQQGKIVPAS